MQILNIRDFLNHQQNTPVIDVRSPGEYVKGHIPGAFNIPLFSDEERATVGTTYKQLGKDLAVKEGLRIVGPKMTWMLEELEKIVTEDEVSIYCWRGGMRSSSVAWLFETSGYNCSILEGGYKSYRKLMDTLFDDLEIILIGGETGSGKTEVLRELKELGEQVIDLEALANHKGSAFGSIGMPEQPTNEQFQNLVIHEFLQVDKGQRIFLEDESSHIGKVSLPDKLWKKMSASAIIPVSVPVETRVNRLVNEYGENDQEKLAACIRKIERKLGGQNMKMALSHLVEGDLEAVARIMLSYYDKSYRYLLDRKKENIIEKIQTQNTNPDHLAGLIISKLEEVEIYGRS